MLKSSLFLGALASAALLVPAAGAGASGAASGDVVATGTCSGTSSSVLKARFRDGGIEVQFEVDSNVVGQTWSWTLRDGTTVRGARATTVAPSGSFEVTRLIPNLAGPDHITAAARNVANGERCTAQLTI